MTEYPPTFPGDALDEIIPAVRDGVTNDELPTLLFLGWNLAGYMQGKFLGDGSSAQLMTSDEDEDDELIERCNELLKVCGDENILLGSLISDAMVERIVKQTVAAVHKLITEWLDEYFQDT